MTTTTKVLPEKIENHTHIQDFCDLFGQEHPTEETIKRQHELWGFSLYLLHSQSLIEALKLWFLNSREVFDRTKGIFAIPHTYIFGSIALWFILQYFSATFLFLPIFFILIFIWFFPIIKIIREKMEQYMKSRVFFNYQLSESISIVKDFLEVQPYTPKKSMWGNKKRGYVFDGNSTWWKLFLFLISQPFIFFTYHILAGSLIVFDIVLFCVLFGIIEKGLFLFGVVYYVIYFFLYDHMPFLFSRADRERNFYMDLHEHGIGLIGTMKSLEKDIKMALTWDITPTLGENLEKSIVQIQKLLKNIQTGEEFLKEKVKFQHFLIWVMNEILTTYAFIFENFAHRMEALEQNIDLERISPEKKEYLLTIIKPILDSKKVELKAMHAQILAKRII